jgi:anti-sigma-K factor RskA
MTHEELSEMYELYALGVLTPEEKSEIDEHLGRGCVECSVGVRRALEVNAMFTTLTEQVNAPKRLRKRVLASIGGRRAASGWTSVWAIAAACLAIALVILGLKTMGDLDQTRRELRTSNETRDQTRRELLESRGQLSKVQQALQFLNEPETVQATFGGGQALPPRGRIFVNPSRGVLLIASHLPPAPAGQTYEMWVVPKKGNPVAAGLFQSDAQGNALHLMAGPVNRAQTAAIAVSVEPESGSPAPTTKPFIVAPLGG